MYDVLTATTLAADLTASTNSDAIDLKGGIVATPLVARVRYTQATGTTPSVKAVIQQSADGTTWEDLTVLHDVLTSPAVPLIRRKRFVPNLRYVRVAFTVGGTTPNFGRPTVEIGSGDTEQVK